MINNDNIQILKELIDSISDMIVWSNKSLKSSELLETFKTLVYGRRSLKRIHNALSMNPTIAAFGESQQGKSYIISSLLSSPGHPLKVMDDNGNMINFIENFNYQTDKTESTGVVSRFTSKNFAMDKSFPIKLHLFSLPDIIIMLANSFMVDVIGYTPYLPEDLKKIVSDLRERYSDKPNVQNIMTEDEVGDIEDYLVNHNQKDAAAYVNAGYFDCLSMIIRRIPIDEWPRAFEPLWKGDKEKNVVFTELLRLVIGIYRSIDFSAEVYVSSKVVQNDFNDGWVTMMSVKILKDHLQEYYEKPTQGVLSKVKLPDGKCVDVNKSILGLLTAEVVYHVDDSIMKQPLNFDFSGIRDTIYTNGNSTDANDNIDFLRNKGLDRQIDRSFLTDEKGKGFDLLDFPGARGRENGIDIKFIKEKIADLMLRCKVAYLFNKYSEERRLSILLLCHSGENSTPNLIAPIISDWVNKYIGKTPEDRKSTIDAYQVAPLFLISTMYNKNLVVTKNSEGKFQMNAEMFKQRFDTVMYGEIINHKLNDWFDSFLPGNKRFSNTYILRDFLYSSDRNGCSGIFKGYPGPEEIEKDVEERKKIKTLFLEDESVKLFFPEPELIWDVTSTLNNDGTYYMIKQLCTATENANKARNIKFSKEIEEILKVIMDTISPKYKNNDEGVKLQESITQSKRFNLAVRMTSEMREDFFGRFIQFLQITPNHVSSEFFKIIHSTRIPDSTEIRRYELIIKGIEESGKHFVRNDKKYNMSILHDVFGITTENDPLVKGLDLETLFNTEFKEVCSASYILSKNLIEGWLRVIMAPENSLQFTQMGLNPMVLTTFLSNFEKMSRFVDLISIISSAIKEYVDYVPVINDKILSLISDVSANIYNQFVVDMGYSLLNEETINDVKLHNDKYSLNLSFDYDTCDCENMTEEENVEKIFQSLESLGDGNGGQMIKLPSYARMKTWIEQVTISYIASFKTEDYDVEANEALGKILSKFSENKALALA